MIEARRNLSIEPIPGTFSLFTKLLFFWWKGNLAWNGLLNVPWLSIIFGKFDVLCFLENPFWDSPFYLITDDLWSVLHTCKYWRISQTITVESSPLTCSDLFLWLIWKVKLFNELPTKKIIDLMDFWCLFCSFVRISSWNLRCQYVSLENWKTQ